MQIDTTNRMSKANEGYLLVWLLIVFVVIGGLLFVLLQPRNKATLSGKEPELVLDEKVRSHLFKSEQHVNVLTGVSFKKMSHSLSEADLESLSQVFTADFSGMIPSDETSPYVGLNQKEFNVSRIKPKEESKPVDGSEIVEWFGAISNQYQLPIDCSISLTSIYPASSDNPNGAWKGTGKIFLSGKNSQDEFQEHRLYFSWTCKSVAEKVLEGQNWLSEFSVLKMEISKAPNKIFQDVTRERGVDISMFHNNWDLEPDRMIANSGGVYFADINRDGLMDMAVTDVKHPSQILVYTGQQDGTLKDSTKQLGIIQDHGGMLCFVDLDGDGWEDLIQLWNNSKFGMRAYRNVDGKKFIDATHVTNLPELISQVGGSNVPTGMTIADYDLDGNMDLYVTRSAGLSFKSGSWIDGKSGIVSNNQLLRNKGGAQFEDVTEINQADGGRRSTASSVWIHANDDLYPDLYVIDEFGNGQLLANKKGRLEPVDIVSDPVDWGSMGVTAGDFNNDGITDFYVNNMYSKAGKRVIGNLPDDVYDPLTDKKLRSLVDGSELYVGAGNYQYEPSGNKLNVDAVGWSWGPSMADFNNDGWPDIYATAGYISVDRSKPDG